MTINGTAMWLLALYVALARERGVPLKRAARHDAERHRQGVPRARHVHLPARAVARSDRRDVRVRRRATCRSGTPPNVCSYHLQEAGATPVQELAFALADRDRRARRAARPRHAHEGGVRAGVGRVSFFVNAGMRFVEEMCKMRAFAELWDQLVPRALRRRGSEAAPVPLRRAGQLARAHRAAAREQRVADPDRDARRDAVARRALPRAAAADVERGAVAAAAVGPAVVAAAAADPRARDRPARVPRPVRGLDRRAGAAGRADRGRRARSWRASTPSAAPWRRSSRG